jgi:hypothetical protein
MVWAPVVSAAGVIVADPPAIEALPRTVTPSEKVMVPVAAVVLRVAVKVTVWP